jgi:outer membrane usher protein
MTWGRSQTAVLIACWGLTTFPVLQAQPVPAGASATAGIDIIVSIRSNDVDRGEFTVLQTPDGDYWVPAADLPRLKAKAEPAARRSRGSDEYFSLRMLAAHPPVFDEATLSLVVDFPAGELEATRIDLSGRPALLPVTRPSNSMIMNYRAAALHSAQNGLQLRLTGELNVRVGEFLLRQEAKVETGRNQAVFARGPTQLVWDDRVNARRVLAGDQVTTGGPFGSTIPAIGISLNKTYGITPDVIRAPTASFIVPAITPSQVEVSVDGSTVYRTRVPPGPISVENLFYYNGVRDLRVTVVDASGRRQVYDQPFLFTDTVLARGLHEYSYFVGRRSELRADDRLHYRESAWQGWHRYGWTDQLTVEGGAEGSDDFAVAGAGISLRSDRLGLLSLGTLHSFDRAVGSDAQGWTARYSYIGPQATFYAARRTLQPGFRTFGGTQSLRGETRLGASTRLGERTNVSLDYTRSSEAGGLTETLGARAATAFSTRATLFAEYLRTRSSQFADAWAFNVYLRYELEPQRWVGTTVRGSAGYRAVEAEVGKQVPQGEGVGYRVGSLLAHDASGTRAFEYGNATWNLPHFSLDAHASGHSGGGGSSYGELAVEGAVVALDGYVGATRSVPDSFALARLGVRQAGVDIYLNSQVQGKTDADGNLLIPNLGAFGRQTVTLDDKQLSMEYSVARTRAIIAPPYRSGSLVAFGGRKLRAVTGRVWLLKDSGRQPAALVGLELTGPEGRVSIETAPSGEFYLEDAPPGHYSGVLVIARKSYSCEMNIPPFSEAVHEVRDGLACR